MGVQLPAELNEPEAALPPGRVVGVLRDIAGHFFPLLPQARRPPMSRALKNPGVKPLPRLCIAGISHTPGVSTPNQVEVS